jgi:hypothetical protein
MKYKAIKSAAHNFGDSFVSLLNYRAGDYVMSHLARLVVETGRPELSFDLFTGRAQPRALLWGPVRASIAAHIQWFPDLLASQQIDRSAITGGNVTVVFRPEQRTTPSGPAGVWQIPFECVVILHDDRGKSHEGRVHNTWIVDGSSLPPRWRRTVYWWHSELRLRMLLFRRLLARRLTGRSSRPA